MGGEINKKQYVNRRKNSTNNSIDNYSSSCDSYIYDIATQENSS